MNMNDKTPEELENIGRQVVEAQEKRREYIEKNRALWISDGQKARAFRNNLKISATEMAKHIGCSEGLIYRLESGQNVRRRRMLEQSYRTSMKCIYFERQEKLKIFCDEKKSSL